MLRSMQQMRGFALGASDESIGAARDFYFDDTQWCVRYLVVEPAPWRGEGKVLIRPDMVRAVNDEHTLIEVHLNREEVRRSPSADSVKPVSRQHAEWQKEQEALSAYRKMAGAAGWGAIAPRATDGADGGTKPPPENAKQTEADPHLRSSAVVLDGYTLRAEDGEVGRVQDFIVDDQTWQMPYAVVRTGGYLFGHNVLVPTDALARISLPEAEVFSRLPAFVIKEAPRYDGAEDLGSDLGERLHEHYGPRQNSGP